MFLRNVGCISTDYTASHPRRWYSYIKCLILVISIYKYKNCRTKYEPSES
jgi:hypothetical protein